MVTQVSDEREIDEFAKSVGEWLLTQRFGSIQPVAYRWSLFDPPPDWPDEGDHVVIELTVEDPPPPPKTWRSLPEEEALDALLWPEEDMRAAERATGDCALSMDIPRGIAPLMPVRVVFLARSEVEGNGRLPVDD